MDEALAASGRFTVNVLGEADHSLARRFSRPDRGQGWASFSGVPLLRRDPSPPVLSRAVAWADCAVVQAIPMGDHCCYAGEVLDAGRDETAPPLAYYRGRLRALGPAIAPTTWATTGIADLTAVW
jgi:flavin reductase (DIM6/NTAB) family NADH-FMN oxidoreductase RutF